MSKPTDRPYWLEGGNEACASCTHVHVYEMQCRCAACDRGICCHCVRVHVASGELLCPECEAETEEA